MWVTLLIGVLFMQEVLIKSLTLDLVVSHYRKDNSLLLLNCEKREIKLLVTLCNT